MLTHQLGIHNNYLRYLLIITPIFVLTWKHWISTIVIIFFLGSLFFNCKCKNHIAYSCTFFRRFRVFFIFSLLLPFISVFISQLIRGEIYLNNYDAPLRFVFCASIFLAISNGWLSDGKHSSIGLIWIKFSFPTALLWIYLYQPAITHKWGYDRLTTYFVDPLSFGIYTLLFSITTFIILNLNWQGLTIVKRIYLFVCLCLGIYLSIQSGSRTGWIFLPFLFIILLSTRYTEFNYWNKKNSSFLFLLSVMLILPLLMMKPYFFEKIILGYTEFYNYKWNDINPDNSTSLRISLYRIGLNLFMEKPLSGWGELGWLNSVIFSSIRYYFSENTIITAKHGFHNEYITNSVKSGILGTISSLTIFLAPIYFSLKIIFLKYNLHTLLLSYFLLIISSHLLIAGLTTDTTNLIYLSSFIGLLFSVLAGEILYFSKIKSKSTLIN